MDSSKGLILKACAITALGLLSQQVNSATVSYVINGSNDCNGFFGSEDRNGFKGCVVAFEGVQLSPVIAKYDVDDYGVVTNIDING